MSQTHKAITCPVIIDGISTRKDGSLGVRISTPELKPDEKLAWLELAGRNCKVLVQAEDNAGELLKEVKGEFARRTPSQQIRAVLFVLWKHLTDTNQCEILFENFYLKETTKYCDSIKAQLPERF